MASSGGLFVWLCRTARSARGAVYRVRIHIGLLASSQISSCRDTCDERSYSLEGPLKFRDMEHMQIRQSKAKKLSARYSGIVNWSVWYLERSAPEEWRKIGQVTRVIRVAFMHPPAAFSLSRITSAQNLGTQVDFGPTVASSQVT